MTSRQLESSDFCYAVLTRVVCACLLTQSPSCGVIAAMVTRQNGEKMKRKVSFIQVTISVAMLTLLVLFILQSLTCVVNITAVLRLILLPIYVVILRARCSGASSHAVHGVLYDGSPRVALLLAAGQHLHHLWFLYSSRDQKETCGRDGTLTHTTDLCCVSLFIKCVTRSACKAEKKEEEPDLAPRWPLLGLSGSAER